jgi:ribosomal protein S27E
MKLNNTPKLKNDKYRKVRGGHSRFLRVSCESCGEFLFLYQKDGPGPLKRVYIDRIISLGVFNRAKQLSCKSCKKVIGTFYIYPKEKRPAYRLYQDAVIKKIIKGKIVSK